MIGEQKCITRNPAGALLQPYDLVRCSLSWRGSGRQVLDAIGPLGSCKNALGRLRPQGVVSFRSGGAGYGSRVKVSDPEFPLVLHQFRFMMSPLTEVASRVTDTSFTAT